MQIKINGSHYGEWGIQRFGAQSRKVGASCLGLQSAALHALPHNTQDALQAQEQLVCCFTA